MAPRDSAEMEKFIQRVSCPVCSGGKIALSGGEAACKTCGFAFVVLADPDRLHAEEPGLAEKLKGMECPDCGEKGGEILCRCELPSGEIFYIVCCFGCGFPYKERAEIKKPRV